MQTASTRLAPVRLAVLTALSATVAASFLAGCTAAPEPPGQQSSPPSSAASAAEPSSGLERYLDAVRTDGASAVVIQMKTNGEEWTRAVGVRSQDNQEPVQLTDQVHIGDATIPMVAVSVMKLVEEGKLRLDDPVSRHLPELATMLHPPGPVSVRSLLNHRSGMPSYWEALLASAPMQDVLAKRMTHEERLAVAASVPWEPRGSAVAFSYSNSNYAALALLVERLRGATIGEVLRTDIAEPLGLDGTLMTGAEPGPEQLIHGYALLGNKPVDVALPAIHIGSADSGMISTVPDLNAFPGALAQGKLLDSKTVAEMTAPDQANEEEGYGLGLQHWKDACTGNYYFGHVGDVPGYGTVAITSADGSRQAAMAVALPPASPREDFNPRVQEMVDRALEALNKAC
ncbi:serine hydrolase [Arthrobacter sp. ISL-72]|uniref:serine hydrolase domain-containing protein n=1 Tax=Arthrobacter sp. ISL-72 TaxID=2819114 RepID=UPI001BE9E224|nr:serine hydrolase domain-containing protein [Arthrobacter sp. ISL-72]MBT2593730.1 beta-lactamase family protein [Arthrobacter sp. ISL-72]